jgi:hypothetical protein
MASLSRSAYGEMVHNAAAVLFYEFHPEETSSRFGTPDDEGLSILSENIKSSDFIIYPNPSKGHITCESAVDIITVEIYNIYGGQILKTQHFNSVIQINISTLSDGIYFVKAILTNGESISSKLVLQK